MLFFFYGEGFKIKKMGNQYFEDKILGAIQKSQETVTGGAILNVLQGWVQNFIGLDEKCLYPKLIV